MHQGVKLGHRTNKGTDKITYWLFFFLIICHFTATSKDSFLWATCPWWHLFCVECHKALRSVNSPERSSSSTRQGACPSGTIHCNMTPYVTPHVDQCNGTERRKALVKHDKVEEMRWFLFQLINRCVSHKLYRTWLFAWLRYTIKRCRTGNVPKQPSLQHSICIY